MADFQDEKDPLKGDDVFRQVILQCRKTKPHGAGFRRVSRGTCYRLGKTLALCVAFFGLGLCLAIPGPTLLDLMYNLNTDLASMSSIYIWRSSGCLIGSVLAGFLFDKFNRSLLIFSNILLTAVSISSIIWYRSIWLFSVSMTVVGTSMGFLNTGGNVLCLDLWGKNSGPFMQALHFFFGVGAFTAPLLAQPFLEIKSEGLNTNVSSISLAFNESFPSINDKIFANLNRQDLDNDTQEFNATTEEEAGLTNMQRLYLILGLIEVSIALVFLGFYCFHPKESKSKQTENVNPDHKMDTKVFVILILLMALFYLFYVGMEVTFGQMLLTYCVESDLHLTKISASYVTATFWGSFAVMRFLAIFFSGGFSPLLIMLLEFLLCGTGSVALSIFGNQYESVLWIGSAFLGAGFASVFPTGILWMERYIVVSNKVAAAFVVGGAMGEMVCPFVVGRFMATTPTALIHFITFGISLCIVMFSIVWFIASRQGEKHVVAVNLNLK